MTEPLPTPLGYCDNSDDITQPPYPITVNIDKLIGNHVCLMAMSGGGKSGAARKLLEVTHGHLQQIVLDPEDEFYTLREAFDDFLIAGGEDQDCPANLANAAALAMMLLETGKNAVIQLNDLPAEDQQEFVRLFITSLMSAPRALWHPLLLVLDESHRFAPQDGYAASSAAVKDFTSRGRKRGFTAVLATQRMAKIDKNVTGDVTNWMIGLVGQGTDRRVASDQLGFSPSSAEGKGLQMMPSRHFWAFGPAWAVPPKLFRVADTKTTIVKAGQARLPTPPAPEAMRAIMEAMAEAAKPPATPDSAPSSAKSGSGDGVTQDELEKACESFYRSGKADGLREGVGQGRADILRSVRAHLDDLDGGSDYDDALAASGPVNRHLIETQPDFVAKIVENTKFIKPSPPRPEGMMSATRKIADIYEKFWPRSLPFLKAAQLAGVGLKSSQFKLYEPDLIASGLVEAHGDGYRAKGGTGVGPAEVMAAYRGQLSPMFQKVFDAIAKTMDLGLTREEIIDQCGISPTSSTTAGATGMMIRDEFVEKIGDRYRIVEMFR